jgi:hypothetical protein
VACDFIDSPTEQVFLSLSDGQRSFKRAALSGQRRRLRSFNDECWFQLLSVSATAFSLSVLAAGAGGAGEFSQCTPVRRMRLLVAAFFVCQGFIQ